MHEVDYQEQALDTRFPFEGQEERLFTIEVLDLPLPEMDFEKTNGTNVFNDS